MRQDFALLIGRVVFGASMALAHGLPKFLSYSEQAQTFSDPLGIGPSVSMVLVIFAELFCAAAVTVGFATRWTAIPVVITMLVAFGIVHANDAFDVREHSLLFAAAFTSFAILGSGRFSIDQLISRKSPAAARMFTAKVGP